MTSGPVRVAVIDSSRVSGHQVAGRAGLDARLSWARFGDRTLVWSTHDSPDSLLRADVGSSPTPTLAGTPHLVKQVGAAFNTAHPSVPVLLDKGRYQVVDCPPDRRRELDDPHGTCWIIQPLEPSAIVLDRVETAALVDVGPTSAASARLIDGLSLDQYASLVETLASRPTRHSLSSDFRQAAAWAQDHLEALNYDADIVPVDLPTGTTANVVGRRSGTLPEPIRKEVVVTAHLDSVNASGGASAPAPGADDNASGAAGVLEIGRVLSEVSTAHDLTLILFGGEEQGLHGSTSYVSGLTPAQRQRVLGVINMDMVAVRNGPRSTVLLEGASVSLPLMEALAKAAEDHTSLEVETSLNPFASDHVPFINASIPAVLTIEGNDRANTAVHTADDTLTRLDLGFAVEILKMNLAATADLVGLPGSETTPRASGPVVAWGPNRLDVFVVGFDPGSP